MTVGLLLITHDRIGTELLRTATRMLGCCPLCAQALEVGENDDPDLLRGRAGEAAAQVDQGGGILVLTDLCGSTPANVAQALVPQRGDVQVLSGVNLPMLVRVLNYAELGLAQLAEKAHSGGRDGVLRYRGAGEGWCGTR